MDGRELIRACGAHPFCYGKARLKVVKLRVGNLVNPAY
ncbi:hypothetical protein TERTU_1875 [Teredinibacter turnerae T7901]|uniref:Uncharacterized protein n=1 Tax=Teredinibacter turnerae (strain ATCC 39867 / T7901) TaxID=377629 RepID=C5BHY5_TERTT|nr:hypothetical protein TERTU_1875 [Teredinibacter turnerae T7901]